MPTLSRDSVNWYEALFYANFKSSAEGLESCYSFSDCEDNAIGTGQECASVTFQGFDCTGYRLPTEAEWNTPHVLVPPPLAQHCRCASPEPNLDDIGWYYANSPAETHHPVEGLEPNRWGLYDMAVMFANVWDYYSPDYSLSGTTDPLGPNVGVPNLEEMRTLEAALGAAFQKIVARQDGLQFRRRRLQCGGPRHSHRTLGTKPKKPNSRPLLLALCQIPLHQPDRF